MAKLNDISFADLEEYEASSYLFLPVFFYYTQGTKTPLGVLSKILPYVGTSSSYRINRGGEKAIFFLSGRYSRRKDNQRQFANALSCAADSISIVGYSNLRIMPKHILNLTRSRLWFLQMKKAGLSDSLSAYLVPFVARAYNFKSLLDSHSALFVNARYAVTLFDQDYDECMFVQFCKKMGLTTATLQHGHFSGTTKCNDLSSLPFPYTNLNADYFLAWGNESKRNAVACGVNEQRILVVGNPSYLKSPHRNIAGPPLENPREFGLVLDGDMYTNHLSNETLIAYADALCRQFDFSCYVRFHPGDTDRKLINLVSRNRRMRICDKSLELSAFSQNISFSIAYKSSVYIELLNLKSVVFRYSPKHANNIYSEIDVGVFSSQEELFNLINKFLANPPNFQNNLFKKAEDFCVVDNVKERLKRAFCYLEQKT